MNLVVPYLSAETKGVMRYLKVAMRPLPLYGCLLLALILSGCLLTSAEAQTLPETDVPLHSFNLTSGFYPYASLIQGKDGFLYGTTAQDSVSTVFQISTDGSIFNTLHIFSGADGSKPYAALIQGKDGFLYGTALIGGVNNDGTVFRMSTDGSIFNTLHSFSGADGSNPYAGLIQGKDGFLYGTTQYGGVNGDGTVFRMSTDGSIFNTLHSFSGTDGSYPYAALIQGKDGFLYGTTEYAGAHVFYGTVFQISTDGTTFNTLHSFGSSAGTNPEAALIQGKDGFLYGTTLGGGAHGYGTVFQISTDGSTFNSLYSFSGSYTGVFASPTLIQGSDGKLYGTTISGGINGESNVFQMSTDGTTFNSLHSFSGSDGSYPNGLIQGKDGFLYGTTQQGGVNSYGTVYQISTDGTTFNTLHSFGGGVTANPTLIQGSDGKLYGTTISGGMNSDGSVFQISTDGTIFNTLHSFSGADGSKPYAALIQGKDGFLYGTTLFGGVNGYGTVYQMSTDGTIFNTLHSFSGADGSYPYAALIQGKDGFLYGTAFEGGAHGYGTVFQISTDGTIFNTLHSFDHTDGWGLYAGVIQGKDGFLYGTTVDGGAYGSPSGYGTIFQISTDGTTFNSLHSFSGADGSYPEAGLIQGKDGKLYGTTQTGGVHGDGTVFQISTDGTTFNALHSFGSSDGANPTAALIQGKDGKLYGTTQTGVNGHGNVFQISTDGTTFNSLYAFSGGSTDGSSPNLGLLQAQDGNLYGTTSGGGVSGAGALFRIGPKLTTLSSTDVAAGSSAFTLTLTGSGFASNDVVYLNHSALATTYHNATQLSVTIPATDLLTNSYLRLSVYDRNISNASNSLVLLVGKPHLTLSATLARNGSNLVATLTLTNSGNAAATSTQLTSATLGGVATTSSPLPAPGTLTAGQQTSVTLTFPGSAASSGQTVLLQVAGTYTTGNFGASLRLTAP